MTDKACIVTSAALEAARTNGDIAKNWIEAWNSHDLERILSHYAEDVEFIANTVASRWQRPDGAIKGKADLRRHFARGLELASDLHFEMQGFFTCPRGYAVLYRRENGNCAIDAVRLNEVGMAVSVTAYYAAPQR